MERALVGDDDAFMTSLIGNLFDVMNIESVICMSAEDALAELAKASFDYLVTDLMMPCISGLELCRRVRNDLGLGKLKIVMVTAKKLSVDERKELMKLKVRLMVKPISPHAFVENIRAYVEPDTL